MGPDHPGNTQNDRESKSSAKIAIEVLDNFVLSLIALDVLPRAILDRNTERLTIAGKVDPALLRPHKGGLLLGDGMGFDESQVDRLFNAGLLLEGYRSPPTDGLFLSLENNLQSSIGTLHSIFPNPELIQHLYRSAVLCSGGLEDVVRVTNALVEGGLQEYFVRVHEVCRNRGVDRSKKASRQASLEQAQDIRKQFDPPFQLEDELLFQFGYLAFPTNDGQYENAPVGMEAIHLLMGIGAEEDHTIIPGVGLMGLSRLLSIGCARGEPYHSRTLRMGEFLLTTPMPFASAGSIFLTGESNSSSDLRGLQQYCAASTTPSTPIEELLPNSSDEEQIVFQNDPIGRILPTLVKVAPQGLGNYFLKGVLDQARELEPRTRMPGIVFFGLTFEALRRLDLPRCRDIASFERAFQFAGRLVTCSRALLTREENAYAGDASWDPAYNDCLLQIATFLEGTHYTHELIERALESGILDSVLGLPALRLASSLEKTLGSAEEIIAFADSLQRALHPLVLLQLSTARVTKYLAKEKRWQNLGDVEESLSALSNLCALEMKDSTKGVPVIELACSLLEELNAVRLDGHPGTLTDDLEFIFEYLVHFGPAVLPYTFAACYACLHGRPINDAIKKLHEPVASILDYQRICSRVLSDHTLLKKSGLAPLAEILTKAEGEKNRTLCTKNFTATWTGDPESYDDLMLSELKNTADPLVIDRKFGSQQEAKINALSVLVQAGENRVFVSPPGLDEFSPLSIDDFTAWFKAQRITLTGLQRSRSLLTAHPLVAEAALHSLGCMSTYFEAAYLDFIDTQGPDWRRNDENLAKSDRIAFLATALQSHGLFRCSPAVGAIPIEISTNEQPVLFPAQSGEMTFLLTSARAKSADEAFSRSEYVIRSASRPVPLNAVEILRNKISNALDEELLRLRETPGLDGKPGLAARFEAAKATREALDTAGSLHEVLVATARDPQLRVRDGIVHAFTHHIVHMVPREVLPRNVAELGSQGAPLLTRAELLADTVQEITRELVKGLEAYSAGAVRAFVERCFNWKMIREVLEAERSTSTSAAVRLIKTYPSDGVELRLLGFISDTCAVRIANPLFHRPNMIFFPFIDEEAALREPIFQGGTALIGTEAESGARCLLIRGFTPRAELLKTLHAPFFFESFCDSVLVPFAKQRGFEQIIAPDEVVPRTTLSNRNQIVRHVAKKYGSAQRVPLKNYDSVLFNDYPIPRPCLLIRNINDQT